MKNCVSFTTYRLALTTLKMLLAIDIGNTNNSLGVFDGENLIAQWRMSTVQSRTFDEIGVFVRQMFSVSEIDYKKVSAVVVSSVVPQLDFAFRKMSEKYFGLDTVVLDSTFDFGLKIKYNPPSSVGIDRIVAVSAAVQKYGKPCIICDFGTATTIDAVNSRGEYLGGTIAPGMNVLADALFERTSKLPKVEIKKVETVIGNSTADSIRAGIYFGYAGLVDAIIRRMIAELGEKPKVVATGGLAVFIAESCESVETIDETLILEGLRLVYEKIKKTKKAVRKTIRT
jgi:type III pantothenate kinase